MTMIEARFALQWQRSPYSPQPITKERLTQVSQLINTQFPRFLAGELRELLTKTAERRAIAYSSSFSFLPLLPLYKVEDGSPYIVMRTLLARSTKKIEEVIHQPGDHVFLPEQGGKFLSFSFSRSLPSGYSEMTYLSLTRCDDLYVLSEGSERLFPDLEIAQMAYDPESERFPFWPSNAEIVEPAALICALPGWYRQE